MSRKGARVALGAGVGLLLLYPNVPASTGSHETWPGHISLSLEVLTNCQTNLSVISVPVLENIQLEGTTKGWAGDRCIFETTLRSSAAPEQTVDYMTCHYSRETLALLADEAANPEAISKVNSTTVNAKQKALTKALGRECQFTDPALQAIFQG